MWSFGYGVVIRVTCLEVGVLDHSILKAERRHPLLKVIRLVSADLDPRTAVSAAGSRVSGFVHWDVATT